MDFLTVVKPLGTIIVAAVALLATLPTQIHAAPDGASYAAGPKVTQLLANDRYPALYTGEFGDCMGGHSLINATGFDAAYYADNMTVLFHLAGSTSLNNESVMAYISVEAYGEDRFDLVFDPCSANINSLCPTNSSSPFIAEAIIPVSPAEVTGIPDIALVIPDFEGYATLRLYANSTQAEIGCFQAVMRNGASLSHPKAIGSVLGIFTAVSLLASSATAIYGVNVPVMRTHYAHSLSVLVVFEVFQSFFFSGALSLDWPSVCAAWWSNFAWAAGMINSPGMTKSINNFLGVNQGNSSQAGGIPYIPVNSNVVLQIYGESTGDIGTGVSAMSMISHERKRDIIARQTAGTNNTDGPEYSWNGGVVGIGLPLPGMWSSFAGVLAEVGIPASNAFMTGFIWVLIALVIVVGLIITFKWALEGFSAAKWIQKDRLDFFRCHWMGYVQVAVLRTMMASFFMIMTLSLYQFSISGTTGVLAISGIVFTLFFVGLLGTASYCCFLRLRFGHYEAATDRIIISHKKIWKVIPGLRFSRQSQASDTEEITTRRAGSFPVFLVRYVDDNPERSSVHEDQSFIKRFGWLSARFRRTRWWYFAVWFGYQFIRACFVGGASQRPSTQVVGLLAVEIIAMIIIVVVNPFEGSRNTALCVYLLSISKVVTTGLSVAYLPQHNLARIPATIIGFVIIITQGLVAIAVLILMALGVISSYMSLTRNREYFKPAELEDIRFKYFMHLERAAADVPPPPPPKPEEPPTPIEPYFRVNSVRRAPKIEDEYADMIECMTNPRSLSNSTRSWSRTNSTLSTVSGLSGVPFGARVHRASWSARDLISWQQQEPMVAPYRGTHSRHGSANDSKHSSHISSTTSVPVQTPRSLGRLDPDTPITRESQWPLGADGSSYAEFTETS